ncbi:MAG: EAL domain-containing protein [Gammaproteobacteria bacterium]|nr:EAL domain-containing protein [Gammaproteobacteria bacterium]
MHNITGSQETQKKQNFFIEGKVAFYLDDNGLLDDASTNISQLGYTLKQIKGLFFDDLIDWSKLGNPVHANLLEMLKDANSLHLPIKTGSTSTWFNIAIEARNSDRYTILLKNINSDNTDTKALTNNALLWNLALDSFDDPLYILDLDEKVVRANSAFYRFKNLSPEQVLGKKITTIMHPDGEDSPCEACIARAERRDTYITLEPDHKNNASGKPLEIMVRNIRNDQGEPIGTLMGARDLTRSRQHEDELRRLNQHISLLMESTGEGIFGIDSDLKCTFVNRAAAKMLKFSRDEMLGKNMIQLIHHSHENGEPYSTADCAIYKSIHEGLSYWSDDDIMWEKGNIAFPVQYRVNPIFVDGKINGAVVVFRNVSKSRAMTQQMNYLARHDYLTGLFNRMVFEERLAELVNNASENRKSHALCYMDLDQFKIVNDTCGHLAGDKLLQKLSKLLKETISHQDTIARLGGDEFGLLLQDCDEASVQNLVDKILNTVSNFRFAYEDKIFSIGVSIGVVLIDTKTRHLDNILAAADSACYLAKEEGRNRYHLYRENDEALISRHKELQWVSRLKSALEENRIVLYGQKITPTNGKNASRFAVEILMRIKDENQLISPSSFMSAAERYDLMPSLDRVVINDVFEWLEKQLNHPKIHEIEFFTINISGLSISQSDFLPFLKNRVRKSGIPGYKLCFELTETAAVSNLENAGKFMTELKNLGCKFALDDFGSGMSSFTYLKHLPVDFLKIDGHFIKNIINDPIDNAMVMAVNQVGHVMGLKTIAEYVEDDDVQRALVDMGIDYIQGYNVGQPELLDKCFGED